MKKHVEKKTVAADSRIVDAFWKIVEPDKSVRIQNIQLIVDTLSLKSATFDGETIFPDLEYVLNRLITGLASSRKAARQGFSVALSEVLRTFSFIDPSHVVSLTFKLIPFSNKQGEREAPVIGQILAFESLIRSGILANNPDCIPSVVESVLDLSDKKPYVEHASCLVLQDILQQVNPQTFSQHLWPVFQQRLSTGWDKSPPKLFWLLCVCVKLFPDVVNDQFLLRHWNTDKLFTENTYTLIGKLLKQSTLLHPLVHPLCIEVINQLISVKKKEFKMFWELAIEKQLLNIKEYEEAYLMFDLLMIAVPKTSDHKIVSYMLSPKLLELFVKSLKTKYSPLHMAASQLCNFLVDHAGKCEDPKIQFAILEAFVRPPGTLLFDSITKKTSVQTLTSQLKFEALQKYGQLLLETLENADLEEDNQNLSDSIKCHVAGQLASLTRHPLAQEDWKSEILQQLFLHGFFKVEKGSTEIPWCSSSLNLTDSLREACRTNFLRGLEFLQTPPVKKGLYGRLEHQQHVLTPLLDFANLLLHSPDIVQPVKEFENLLPSWNKMYSMLRKIIRWREKDGKDQETKIFQVIYLELCFQLFYDLESTKRILNEVNECCKRSLRIRRHNLQHNEVEQETDEPPWPDVLMDLFLSILSNKSQFMRSLVSSVFPALCPFLTSDSMKQLMEAINPVLNNNNPLENDDSENEEVEFHSGSSSDSDEEEEEIVDEVFRKRVQAALGYDEQEGSGEEVYLSDSEMLKLDDAIGEAFRSRAQPDKKKEKLKDQEAQLHFRMRCLELLFKYVKSEPRMTIIVLAIEPLVNTAKQGLSNRKFEGLSNKACNILRDIGHIKIFKDTNSVNQQDLQTLLQFLLNLIKKVSDAKFKNILIQLCSFTVSCADTVAKRSDDALKEQKELKKWFLKLCKQLISDYFEKGTYNLKPQLFDPLFHACGDSVVELLNSLELAAFDETKRLFKRTQAFALMISIVHKIGSQKLENNTDLQDICSSLIPKLVQAVKEMVTSVIKPEFASTLLELVSVVLQSSQQKDSILTDELLTTLKVISFKKLNKPGKKAVRRIQTYLSSNEQVKSRKRKTSSEDKLSVKKILKMESIANGM